MHMATRQMSVSPSHWATRVFPPSTTASSPAPLYPSPSPSLTLTTPRMTWERPATTRPRASAQTEPRPWRALASRSQPTASFLRMRWRRAAFLWPRESTPSWRWPSPVQMVTVTPAAWVRPAASRLAAATPTLPPTSPASPTTTTTRPRTPPGSHPLCPPRAPPSPCQVMAASLAAPLATPPPPPLAQVSQMTTGWVSVAPGPTPLVVRRGSTASTAAEQHTSPSSTPPITPLDCPRRPPLASVSLRRAGCRTPTSTPTQPSWQPSTLWPQTEWLTSGRESPWRPGKRARSTTPQSAWRWSLEARSWVRGSSAWRSTPQTACP